MTNTNAFRLVVQEKIFKNICYINLYKIISPYSVAINDPQGLYLNKLESPGPRNAPCQILSNLVQQFLFKPLG